MLSILKLDAGGIPQGWVNAEEATKHYADNSVLWTLGDPIFRMRGGISRMSGQQSIIELHSIIAINGTSKINLFDVVPVITKHKLFKRDRGLCAYCGDSIHNNLYNLHHVFVKFVGNCKGGADLGWGLYIFTTYTCRYYCGTSQKR